MNQHTTPSILQRVPIILAITAASYGLPVQAQRHSSNERTSRVAGTAAADHFRQAARDSATAQH